MFYTLPLSLKIFWNLCFLSCKQETACQILKSRKIQVSQVECGVFFLHKCISHFQNKSIPNSFEFSFN